MDYPGDWAHEYDYSNQEWFTGVSLLLNTPVTPVNQRSIDVVLDSPTCSKAARTT